VTRLFARLLRDETAVTYTEYLIVTLFIATTMVGFGRVVTRALSSYLNRIFLIVALPVP
jgi:Flp pilus assembly pilin Flp